MQVGKVETKEPICIKATWTIQVSDLLVCDTGEYFESASFSTFHDESEIKWHLRIYPRGFETKTTKTKDDIFVNLLGKSDCSISADVIIECLNNGVYAANSDLKLNNNETGVVKLGTRKYLVFNSSITMATSFELNCTISITDMKSEGEENVKELNIFRSREHVSFEKLVDCEQFSDVTFNVGGKSLYGHRNLLACHSPVFAAMFQNGMMESSSKLITIEGIEPEVFREMLRYVYAAKVNNIDKFANQLLHVADMYDINGLKYMCEEILSKNLTLDNVLAYFNVAEKYNASKLKTQTINFMKVNAKDIIYRPDFKSSNAMFEVLKMLVGIRPLEAKEVPI